MANGIFNMYMTILLAKLVFPPLLYPWQTIGWNAEGWFYFLEQQENTLRIIEISLVMVFFVRGLWRCWNFIQNIRILEL